MLPAQQHEKEQPAEPRRRADGVQEDRVDGHVVSVEVPACPWVASGRKDTAASRAVSSVGVQVRQANASTVMTAPRIVVISHDCPSGSSSRKRPSCEPNSRSMLSCGLKAAMKEKNPASPAETVKTAAPMDAVFRAVSKVRSPPAVRRAPARGSRA